MNFWETFTRYDCKYCSLIFLILILTCLLFPILVLKWSFYLDKANKDINNPIEYLNLTSISHITKLCKENQTEFINYILNYTEINSNITFKYDETKIKIYNIII